MRKGRQAAASSHIGKAASVTDSVTAALTLSLCSTGVMDGHQLHGWAVTKCDLKNAYDLW